MVLDREEEAKRIMMGGAQAANNANQGNYGDPYGGAMGGYDAVGGPTTAGLSNNDEIQPKARKMAGANNKKQQDDDDDKWEGADTLLD